MDGVETWAVAGAAVVVVIDRVLAHLRARGIDLQKMARQIDRMEEDMAEVPAKVSELHKWHDQRDRDGVPVWYVRQSLEEAMGRLAENIEKQTQVLTELIRAVSALNGGPPGK